MHARARGCAGYICELCGGFPTLSEEELAEYNKHYHPKLSLEDARALGLITDLGEDGLPKPNFEGRGKTSKLFTCPALMQLEIGKNKEGYWTGEHQLEQARLVDQIIRIKWPWVQPAHLYDWSSGHHAFADDALVALKLNANPGGKQPVMRDTLVPVSECGRGHTLQLVPGATPMLRQSFVFAVGDKLLAEKKERVLLEGDALIGKPKGAVQIAKERDVYVKGMSMKGPKLRNKTADELAAAREEEQIRALEAGGGQEDDGELDAEAEEDKGIVRDTSLSLVHVLGQMSDFKNEKCKLQQAIEDLGSMCTWLPKFHAPCNAIEYIWGNGKKRNRKECDFTMATLRKSAFRCMMSTDPMFVRKSFRKARNFQGALRGGSDAFTMYKSVAKIKKERYVSHRRPAPSQFKDA